MDKVSKFFLFSNIYLQENRAKQHLIAKQWACFNLYKSVFLNDFHAYLKSLVSFFALSFSIADIF
jgi:hypothetical protein